jgi:hypothetical protein
MYFDRLVYSEKLMVSREVAVKLYSEKSSTKTSIVTDFISRCKPPSLVLVDAGKAAYYYRCYSTVAITIPVASNSVGTTSSTSVELDATSAIGTTGTVTASVASSLPEISKPYFLYIWLCYTGSKQSNVNMRQYVMFNNEDVKVDSLSYRYFTQMYADPIVYTDKLNLHYASFSSTIIYHRFPISLKSVLDRLPTTSQDDVVVLVEGNLGMIKSRPKLMTKSDISIQNYKHEKETLVASFRNSTIRCDQRYTTVESDDSYSHDKYVRLLSILTDSVGRERHTVSNHCFSFPSRELNYKQILHWLDSRHIPNSKNHSGVSVVIKGFVDDGDCEVFNRTLDSHRCYDNGDYEVYRLRGDVVLEIIVCSGRDKDHIFQRILSMYHELDHTIQETFADPMDLGDSDIAMLRATNSLAFDSMYCRKAPPRVQPVVIRKSQIPTELAKGKMILVYESLYYTTRDKETSGGADYIGIVNKFGYYDPSKPYSPIIRTYKKNHLVSKTFKELKAYLLRHSTDHNCGYISPEDILLPESMRYLYSTIIHNNSADVSVIHTKKTVVANSNKVSSSEVPDYIKSMLGTNSIRRIMMKDKLGTGLLETCEVDSKGFFKFVLLNNDHTDTLSLTDDIIEQDITTGNVDHRVYGKLVEEYTGCSLIVFSMEGLVPYRISKLTKSKYRLLFLSADGTYDYIVALPQNNKQLNIIATKETVNSTTPENIGNLSSLSGRNIDYTLVMIKLVCYVSRVSKMLNLDVSCELIPEERCRELVENVYNSCIYYECIAKASGARYINEMVNIRKTTCRINRSILWIKHILGDIVVLDASEQSGSIRTVTILSPVDITKYNLWDINLEDCLYDSVNCYKLSNHEEIQYIYT